MTSQAAEQLKSTTGGATPSCPEAGATPPYGMHCNMNFMSDPGRQVVVTTRDNLMSPGSVSGLSDSGRSTTENPAVDFLDVSTVTVLMPEPLSPPSKKKTGNLTFFWLFFSRGTYGLIIRTSPVFTAHWSRSGLPAACCFSAS